MVQTAHETNSILAIGHQPNCSALFENANFPIQNGHLIDIRHIRAFWRWNNVKPVMMRDEADQIVDLG